MVLYCKHVIFSQTNCHLGEGKTMLYIGGSNTLDENWYVGGEQPAEPMTTDGQHDYHMKFIQREVI